MGEWNDKLTNKNKDFPLILIPIILIMLYLIITKF